MSSIYELSTVVGEIRRIHWAEFEDYSTLFTPGQCIQVYMPCYDQMKATARESIIEKFVLNKFISETVPCASRVFHHDDVFFIVSVRGDKLEVLNKNGELLQVNNMSFSHDEVVFTPTGCDKFVATALPYFVPAGTPTIPWGKS